MIVISFNIYHKRYFLSINDLTFMVACNFMEFARFLGALSMEH